MVLKGYIFILMILGVRPAMENSILLKVYGTCLLGFSLCTVLLSGIYKFFLGSMKEGNAYIVGEFLSVIMISVLWILILSILYSFWKHRISWKRLKTAISVFDRDVSDTLLVHQNKKLEIFKFFLKCLPPFVYLFGNIVFWKIVVNASHLDSLLRTTQDIGLFYEYQIAGFLWEMSSVIQSRYKHLEEEIENVLQTIYLDRDVSHHMFESEIQNIKYKYKLLHDAVRETNVIFGWIIVVALFHVTVLFLTYFYVVVYISDGLNYFLIQAVGFFIMSSVS